MASVSFTVARNGVSENALVAGSQTVTEGTAAPTTGNTLQLRVDMAVPWTKLEIAEAMDIIERYIQDANACVSIPL